MRRIQMTDKLNEQTDERPKLTTAAGWLATDAKT
jgi:hypothetical protein